MGWRAARRHCGAPRRARARWRWGSLRRREDLWQHQAEVIGDGRELSVGLARARHRRSLRLIT
eukprot:8123445-Pyramimonas_sp.AAC.1